MPPKSKKRKASAKSNTTTNNGDNALTAPDRNTWPGWIEMESEPAFFNVMLKDMGVHGVKMSEVWSLDDNDLLVLPQPVHALIFLFRYRETDKDDLVTECPADVWYAEQVPDFACATVALLNIVNNIPGLEMGKELRNFKEFTQKMTPHLKGEAIDAFDFVKRIHNSFAREADILQADMVLKEKAAKARKRQAVAKAKKTRAENAARKGKSNSPTETPKTTRTSARGRKSTAKVTDETSPQSVQASENISENSPADAENARTKEHDNLGNSTNSPSDTSNKTNGITTPTKKGKSPAIATAETKDVKHESDGAPSGSASTSTPTKPTANSGKKLKLNAPKTKTKTKIDSNADYTASAEDESPNQKPRRSGRQPKPRKDLQPDTQETEQVEVEVDEEGFHFCAYMPIGDRVWKLDGMDKFPQDMGQIKEGESWLSIAQPVLQGRMAQYAAGEIEFNIMAVVHDPMLACVEALGANIQALRAVEEKLTGLVDDWKEMLDEQAPETLRGQNLDLGLHNVDIEKAEMTPADVTALADAEDLSQLLELRSEIVLQQCGLRRACSDEMECAKSDEEKAMSRRHDYSKFAREWLGALAEQEMLGALMEEEEDEGEEEDES